MPELHTVLRGQALGSEPSAAVRAATRHLAALAGDSLAALIFFGSRRSGAPADEHSAWDFFVVTRDDLAFYRALHARGVLRRGPRLMAALGRVLPPSQVSLRLDDGRGAWLHVKGSVLTLRVFERECGPRRRDHFCVARLFQPASIVFAADDASRAAAFEALLGAHRATFEWARPGLPAEFDAPGYARRLLEVSLRAEIRPEPGSRAQALWEAQRASLEEVYGALLEELRAAGELERRGARFRLTRAVTPAEARRVRAYFRRSLRRATLRWAKHVLTFEGWLDYIVRKVERHGGRPVQLSPRERRFPLIFLWPRVLRHVLRRGEPGE